MCSHYRRLPVTSFYFPQELGGHGPPAGAFRVCDKGRGCRITVCFCKEKTLGWLGTRWLHHDFSSFPAIMLLLQEALSEQAGADSRVPHGGGRVPGTEEAGIGPSWKEPPAV